LVGFFAPQKNPPYSGGIILMQSENTDERVGWVRERSELSHHWEHPIGGIFCSAKEPTLLGWNHLNAK